MTPDDIGDYGQCILFLLMTNLCKRDTPYFRPRFLGDKYPTFDYIVELVDRPEYYCFLQVKTTTLGYTVNPKRLRINVPQVDINRMVACPAPTYVVGIDFKTKDGFLFSVNEPRPHIASLPTNFKIDGALLALLATEVHDFWVNRGKGTFKSHFIE